VCKTYLYRYTERMKSNSVCYGLTPPQLVAALSQGHLVAKDALAAVDNLANAASAEGFKLGIVSSYRDCEQQAKIVSQKWSGARQLLDDQDQDVSHLAGLERLKAILRFSALPGASRHHWGTDIDVVDLNVIESGHRLSLTPSEYAQGAVLGEFSSWLKECAPKYGFLFPYAHDLGWVSAEPWHLSFAAEAEKLCADWCFEQWLALLPSCLPGDMVTLISAHLDEIEGYVLASMRSIDGN